MQIKFGERIIGAGAPTFLIAEVGINHNGDAGLARELIDAAAGSGADAVKFQTFTADAFLSRSSPYLDLFRQCQLSRDDFAALARHARDRDVLFFSTPLDLESVALLDDLDVPGYKIASCDVTYFPLLREVGSRGKPVLLSTGTATLTETLEAVDALEEAGASGVGIFHCVSHYPAEADQVNLRTISKLEEITGRPTGFSDHTVGTDIPVAAVALGAAMIEKHFTLDKNMDGPDHQLSADPGEFSRMAASVRVVEQAIGSADKRPAESAETITALRRSIVANKDIAKGEVIEKAALTAKRPGNGIQPRFLDTITGRRAAVDIPRDQVMTWDMLE